MKKEKKKCGGTNINLISAFKKLMVIFVLFALFTPVVAYQFSHENVWDNMDFFSKIKYTLDKTKPFTVAGQQRQCSDYPDRASTFTRLPTTISCYQSSECLINFYAVGLDNRWIYLYEKEGPFKFNPSSSLSPSGIWAYEVYDCPVAKKVCSENERRCRTDKSYEKCRNGDWKKYACKSYQTCKSGRCEGSQKDPGPECIVTGIKVGTDGASGYTECISGKLKRFECPSGTHFNYAKQGCISKEKPKPPAPPPEPEPEEEEAEPPLTTLPVEEDEEIGEGEVIDTEVGEINQEIEYGGPGEIVDTRPVDGDVVDDMVCCKISITTGFTDTHYKWTEYSICDSNVPGAVFKMVDPSYCETTAAEDVVEEGGGIPVDNLPLIWGDRGKSEYFVYGLIGLFIIGVVLLGGVSYWFLTKKR